MVRNTFARLVLAGIVAGLLGFVLHVWLGFSVIQPVISAAMKGRSVAHPPYGPGRTVLAAVTALLPGTALAVVFHVVGDRIPGRRRWMKGLLLGLALMAVKGEILREPIMAIAIGNPVWVAVLQQVEKWAVNLAMGVAVALLMPIRRQRGLRARPAGKLCT